VGESEYKILAMFYSQPDGYYDGYGHTDNNLIVGNKTYRVYVRDSFVYIDNTKILKIMGTPGDVVVKFGELTIRGTLFVCLVGDQCFSVLFRTGLAGWKSYSDNLLVCNGGGVSY